MVFVELGGVIVGESKSRDSKLGLGAIGSRAVPPPSERNHWSCMLGPRLAVEGILDARVPEEDGGPGFEVEADDLSMVALLELLGVVNRRVCDDVAHFSVI